MPVTVLKRYLLMDEEEQTNKSLSILRTYINDTVDKSIRDKLKYMFDTVWYETGISEVAPSFIIDALTKCYPDDKDEETDFNYKLFVLRLIVKDAPVEYDTQLAISKYIDKILMPIAKKEEDVRLRALLESLGE